MGKIGLSSPKPAAGQTLWAKQSSPDHSRHSHSSARLARAHLSKAVDEQVIPRLLCAHSDLEPQTPTDRQLASHVGAFAELLVDMDAKLSRDYIEALRARGVTSELLYKELLGPTARHLGTYWDHDVSDLAEIANGFCRLQQYAHECGIGLCWHNRRTTRPRAALLMPMPGEQHTLGIAMVEEVFRQQCWQVSASSPATAEKITAEAKKHWYEVIGLSVGHEAMLDRLATVVANIRRNSRNPNVVIMVGGNVFVKRPDLVCRVGADATASDGLGAIAKLAKFFPTAASANTLPC